VKIRADLHVNGGHRKLVLVPGENEKDEHLALKLAAYLLFWDLDLVVDASVKHPALLGQDYRPDLLGVDPSGSVGAWVECGNTTLNKLFKALRRWPSARVVVLKEDPPRARRIRADLEREIAGSQRVEVLAFPEGVFGRWRALPDERTEVYGEAGGLSFNMVVNEQIFLADLVRV